VGDLQAKTSHRSVEGLEIMWVVRVREDDGDLRPCNYIYVNSIKSRLILRRLKVRGLFLGVQA